MTNDRDAIVTLFRSFLVAMDKWEHDAFCRITSPKTREGDSRSSREIMCSWLPALHDTLRPYCTEGCVQRIQVVDALGSPSIYGPIGYAVVECEIKGEKAKLTTRGNQANPTLDQQHIFLFVKVDGQWKIDGKKEVTDSGRQRKVDLF